MARYVLLVVEDNDDASEFVDWLEKMSPPFETKGRIFVRAMYAKPTQFCSCDSPPGKRDAGYSRGKKFGWWVHSACGKPSFGWANGHGWYATLGTNLLPKSGDAPEYRGDGIWGLSWDAEKQLYVKVVTEEVQGTGEQAVS